MAEPASGYDSNTLDSSSILDEADRYAFVDAGIQMLAMGGQARTMHAPAMPPEMRWVDIVREQVRGAGIHLFEKENLLVKPKEVPFPEGLPEAA